MEYLRVEFAQSRTVLANGDDVGLTNTTLILEANAYRIRLSGSGYNPASQRVVLSGTLPDNPRIVSFQVADAVPPPGTKAGG
jgi:hypothetical protein